MIYILRKKDILFFNMSRRQMVGDKLCSPFLDGLVENLKYSYYVLEIRKEKKNRVKKIKNSKYKIFRFRQTFM